MTPDPFALNLRHLRAVAAIAAQGSLSAAAAAVSLSQPALTQGLGKLERQLGAALFARRSDGTHPTPAGTMLAARVEAAFVQLGTAARLAARLAHRPGRGFARPEWLMTATQLRAVLALADAGGFAAAAGATGLSQPALHRAVRGLEQILGTPITDRQGRGVVLTAAGRRIIRCIRLAALEIGAAIVDLQPGPHAEGRITIGAMPLCRALLLPHAIAAFAACTPRATLDIREGSWRELVNPLRDGSIDLMIGALRPADPPGLEQRALFQDRPVVVARAGHPLAGRGPPDLAALRRYGWIIGQPQSPLRAHWHDLFTGGPPPPAPVECGSVMVIRGVLARTDLLTLLSPDQVALEVQSGLLTPLGPAHPGAARSIGITTRADWRPTVAQARFVAMVEQAAAATRTPQNQ